MYLVDEEDDLPVAFHDFFHYALEAFLELSLILRSCDEGSHIERIDLAALQVLGDVAVHDLGCDPFRDRRLADARLAHQDRVVLSAAAEYLQDSPDLLVPADDRVELSFRRQLVEVGGVLA